MRPYLTIMLLLLGLLLAGCGGGGGGGGSKNAASVTGIVEDSANGDAGVGGAAITIGGATATTTTSAQATSTNPVGSFTINNAQVGASTAKITVTGQQAQTVAFSPSLANGTNPSLTLFINIGQVSGRILLPNGSPANGAFVSIASNGDFVQSNSDGTFLLINVPLGTTTLTAVLGTAAVTQSITVGNGVTALGDVKLLESTDPNPPGSPYTITGTVLQGGGSTTIPATGAQVFLLSSSGVQLEVTSADANGVYYFYVPVGTYQLLIKQASFQTITDSVTVATPSTPQVVPTATLQPQ